MKGLASTSPSFAKVGISARSARKHYGVRCCRRYIEGQHDKSLRSVIANKHETLGDSVSYCWLIKPGFGVHFMDSIGFAWLIGSLQKYIIGCLILVNVHV